MPAQAYRSCRDAPVFPYSAPRTWIYELDLFAEAKHTARNVAKWRRVRGKPPSGPTVSAKYSKRRRSCSSSAGGDASNRLSGGHARADGHRTYPLATARGKSHLTFRPWGKCCGVERARRQNRSRHVSSAGLAEVERKSRWARQCAAENGDRHALACRPHRQ